MMSHIICVCIMGIRCLNLSRVPSLRNSIHMANIQLGRLRTHLKPVTLSPTTRIVSSPLLAHRAMQYPT